MPLSRQIALKHTAVPPLNGKKSEFTAWTTDARYYAKKGVGFLYVSIFVSDPTQYIPVGDMDTENSVPVDRGYSRESVHTYTGVEFPVDGSQEQERQEHFALVYLAEGSVGRSPCVVRPSNGAESDFFRRLNSLR